MNLRRALLVGVVIFGCVGEPDRSTAVNGFARLAKCVDTGSSQCLYRELDRHSRWSVQTIHRTVVQTQKTIQQTFPPEKREGALGRWSAVAETADAAAYFHLFCEERNCLQQLTRHFGAVTRETKTAPDVVLVETTRKGRFTMAAYDGEWGFGEFGEELRKIKLRALDRLAQVRQNAAEFERLRLSGSDVMSVPDVDAAP